MVHLLSVQYTVHLISVQYMVHLLSVQYCRIQETQPRPLYKCKLCDYSVDINSRM